MTLTLTVTLTLTLTEVRLGRAPAVADCAELWEAMEGAGVDVLASNLPPAICAWCASRRRAADARVVLTSALSTSALYALGLVLGRGHARIAEDAVDLVHSSVAMVASAKVTLALALTLTLVLTLTLTADLLHSSVAMVASTQLASALASSALAPSALASSALASSSHHAQPEP